MSSLVSEGGLPPARTRGRFGWDRSTGLLILVSAVILAVSVEAGVEAATGGNKLLMIVPAAALVGIGLVVLGLLNFEAFAFATIAIRASLDMTKPTSGNSGAAGIATAGASGIDPAGVLAILFMVTALFWWMSRRMTGQKSPPASIHRIALITFAGVGYLSVVDSSAPVVSLLEAIRVSAVATMLAVMEVLLVDRAAVKRMLFAIYLSSIPPILVALYFIASHHPQFTSGGFGRYEGTFSQPNPFAIYLTMLIVMGVAIIPHVERRQRYLILPILLLSTVCLYYTYTRSAWVAAVVGVFAVAFLGRRKWLAVGLTVALLSSLVVVPSLAQRFADLGSSTPNAVGNTSNSLAWRFDYWGVVLPLAEKDPVTGIGLKMSSFETVQAKEPHNDFLRAYVETGAVGVLAYLFLIASMIMVARDGMRKSGPGLDKGVAVGFAGCVFAFVLISIVSNVITEVIVLWYYVAFAAAAYAVTQYESNARLRAANPLVLRLRHAGGPGD